MLNLFRNMHPRILSPLVVFLPLLVVAACGLGMDNAARLARAQVAFEAGEYRAAIIDAKNILQQEPRNREARLLLGRSSIRVNDAATAEKELRRAIDLGADLRPVAVDLGQALLVLRQFEQLLEEIQPALAQSESDRLAILRLRGDAMMGLHRPDDARAMYREVLATDSADLSARLGVASSYVAENNNTEARKMLDEMLAIDKGYIPARLASGSLYFTMRNADAAVDEFILASKLARTASDTDAQISALIGLVDAELARNDLAAAKVALAQLQELAPDNLSSIYMAARIAFLEEDYETAQANLQQVLNAAPESRPAQFLMAAVHLQDGNLGQAEMFASSVLAVAPDDVEARKLMAEIRLRQNRAGDAVATLRPLLDSEDSDTEAVRLAARASLEAGQHDNAIGYLRDELEMNPGNVDLQLDLAAAYLAAGQVDGAEALLSTSPEESEENAYRRDLLTVMNALRRDDASTALRDAEEMAARWPGDARVRNLIGGLALSADNLELARESFLAAQELAPSEISAYLNVARVDIERGDFDSARKIAKDLQARFPDNVIPVALEAELLVTAGQFGQAAAVYDKALSLRSGDRQLAIRAFQVRSSAGLEDPEAPLVSYLVRQPEDIELRLAVAQSHHVQGQRLQAIKEYEKVLAAAPDNHVALNNLAWLYLEAGDPRAEEVARRAYEQSPQDGSVADTLGWIQVKKGNFAEGIAMLRKAVEYNDHPEVRYHLAAGLAAAGDKAEAHRILVDLLAGTDSFTSRPEAEELLESL